MKKLTILAAQILCLLLPTSFCRAYGFEGHKIVAMIADKHLTTATREKITDILKDATMADVSSWADNYRQTHRDTSGWHYIDIEISDDTILSGSATRGTILDAISSQSKVLADQAATSESRSMALKFVIHFLGDLSQPLHCADNHDSGGNGVKVSFLGRNGNLHQVWDVMILQKMMAEAGITSSTGDLQKLADTLDAEFGPQINTIQEGNPKDWALQSHKYAVSNAYSYLKDDTLSSVTVTLDQKYFDDNKPLLRKLLTSGGFRLAHVLNAILDPAQATHGSGSRREEGEKK